MNTAIVGSLVLLWFGLDIITGRVWLLRPIHRWQEPRNYWLAFAFWIALGLTLLIS